MTNAEPARHGLYAELERVLGVDHADTLMTHLPQHTSDDAATKADIALLDPRFDGIENRFVGIDDRFNQIEDRFDRMEERFDRMADRMDARFNRMEDRMEDRSNRMEDRMDKMQRNFLTVSFGTLTVMTAVFAIITRI